MDFANLPAMTGNRYPPYELLTLTVSYKNSKGTGICFYQFSVSANSGGAYCYCVHLLSIISKKIHYFNGNISSDICNYIRFLIFACMKRGYLY